MRVSITKSAVSKQFSDIGNENFAVCNVTASTGLETTALDLDIAEEASFEDICNLLNSYNIHYHAINNDRKIIISSTLFSENKITPVIKMLVEHKFMAEKFAKNILQNYPDGNGKLNNITNMKKLNIVGQLERNYSPIIPINHSSGKKRKADDLTTQEDIESDLQYIMALFPGYKN